MAFCIHVLREEKAASSANIAALAMIIAVPLGLSVLTWVWLGGKER
jgi:hypothetical protein